MTVNVNRTVTPAVRDNNAFPAAVYAAKTRRNISRITF